MTRDYDALIAYLEARRDMPFAWGRTANDCFSFAFGGVEALTGIDWPRRLAIDWTDEKSALRVLRKLGGPEAAVTLALTRTEPGFAQRGDVGLVDLDGRQSLVLFDLDCVWGAGLAGRVRLPRGLPTLAWSAVSTGAERQEKIHP